MVDVNRYRPYVGPKDRNAPPQMEQPPESDEYQLPRQTLGRERMTEMGAPMQVPKPPPGLGSHPDDEERQERDVADARGEDGEDYEREGDEAEFGEIDWEERAQSAYRSSTDFFDTNYRKQLEDGLRAFNNQHPSDSKYLSESFRKRSNLYRPRIRTIMRRNEAALCAALFSNLDLIETEAANHSDIEEVVSAEIMKALLNQRLTVSMPWFQFAMGSLQDAQTQGIVIAHSYWRYVGHERRDGSYKVMEDRPCQELIPVENFRFDPSAKWFDVVNTSPYLIELIPMYVQDVRERMEHDDPKGQRWYEYDDAEIAACIENQDESTRAARRGSTGVDDTQAPRDVQDYDIVWVHRHIHRYRGEDFEFYMLGNKHLLSEPAPLEENVWFGERPYVIGTCMLETHKAMPSSLATVLRPLADEANDLQNQVSDNMKFILNKAWFVKRTANVDTSSLTRNTPGRVTLLNDVEKDVKEVSWPDIPRSAYEEKNRNDQDFDQLAGAFNPMTLQQARSPRESFRTVNAIQSPAMMLTEYTLMTHVQTFLLPCLRQLVLLEQYYETDQTLLAVAGQKAQVFKKFGVSEVTDAVLEKRMSVNVNIGMGATDPTTKQTRLHSALSMLAQLTAKPIPGIDLKEIAKELFALAGYRDGQRFMQDGQDPQTARLMQIVQKLTQKLQQLQVQNKNKHEGNIVKLVTAREGNLTKLALAAKEDDHQSRHLLIGHLLEREKMDAQSEQQRALQAEGAVQQQQQTAQQGDQAQQLAKIPRPGPSPARGRAA